MAEHPLLGDYCNGKFGASGFAVCHSGVPPTIAEGRIAIKHPDRWSRAASR